MTGNKPMVTFLADGLAGAAVVGSIFDYVPKIAAVLGLIWYLIQIYESRTMQRAMHRWGWWWASNREEKYEHSGHPDSLPIADIKDKLTVLQGKEAIPVPIILPVPIVIKDDHKEEEEKNELRSKDSR